MRTFLTGAGGYVGLHILRELLDAGHHVTALVRSSRKLDVFARHPRLVIVEADLEDESSIGQSLPGHDVCIHAALIWDVPGSEFEMRDTAVAAKIFDAAASGGLKRCVYISSVAVHRPFSGEMLEEDCLNATDLYSATKAAGELFLRAACAGHQMTGVVVRAGPVVGPPVFVGGSFRSPERIAAMVTAAANGRPIEVVSRDGRQFSDVSALAKAVRLLTMTPDPHSTYICVDRDIITWEQVASLVVGCLDSPSQLHVLPNDAQGPTPFFRTGRFERLIEGSASAEGALLAHIRFLAQTVRGRHVDKQ